LPGFIKSVSKPTIHAGNTSLQYSSKYH
jgi:hypothetical protein